MADFCTNCSSEIFGDVEPDIDVKKIFGTLKDGYFQTCLCEGCGMLAVYREDNTIYGIYPDDIIDDNFLVIEREYFINKKEKIKL